MTFTGSELAEPDEQGADAASRSVGKGTTEPFEAKMPGAAVTMSRIVAPGFRTSPLRLTSRRSARSCYAVPSYDVDANRSISRRDLPEAIAFAH